ncbi:hypothetical protein N7540_009157 [Penicillium herquei]|nr:hypothetical protein N7540_009157 [Penicillium herquei]
MLTHYKKYLRWGHFQDGEHELLQVMIPLSNEHTELESEQGETVEDEDCHNNAGDADDWNAAGHDSLETLEEVMHGLKAERIRCAVCDFNEFLRWNGLEAAAGQKTCSQETCINPYGRPRLSAAITS